MSPKKTKKAPVKKVPAKQSKRAASAPKKTTKASGRKAVQHIAKKESADEKKLEAEKQSMLLEARKRKATPSIFKIRSRKSTPIVFTLDDVKEVLKSKKKTPAHIPTKTTPTDLAEKKVKAAEVKSSTKKRILKAASLSDILGFNPHDSKSKPISQLEESKIPQKFLKYYKSLIELRDQVRAGLDMHTKDTLKRSSKEDTGDLSSYSQHMADAGTDTFDRDFALNLVSNEQDALFEIEEAIQRIVDGNYGSCEITGKRISSDRLEAVPFTRYSLEGQKQLESQKHASKERGGVFAESSLEESAKYTDEDVEA